MYHPHQDPDKCFSCREKRNNLIPELENLEQKNGMYSPFQCGFSPKNLKNIDKKDNIDIMIIQSVHSGGNWNEDSKPLKEAEKYYLLDRVTSYHQSEFRNLIKELDEQNLSWYITDLVKCFIIDRKKGELVSARQAKDNYSIASTNCYSYLEEEIQELNPKIIAIMHMGVSNEIKNKPILEKFRVIDIYQPGSPLWIKFGGVEEFINYIKKEKLPKRSEIRYKKKEHKFTLNGSDFIYHSRNNDRE